jgi:hypothetical protein
VVEPDIYYLSFFLPIIAILKMNYSITNKKERSEYKTIATKLLVCNHSYYGFHFIRLYSILLQLSS